MCCRQLDYLHTMTYALCPNTLFLSACLYDAADINECAMDNGGCSINADCSNTPAGSRTCKCKSGFEGNGVTCTGK